jgi:hypothetical protein
MSGEAGADRRGARGIGASAKTVVRHHNRHAACFPCMGIHRPAPSHMESRNNDRSNQSPHSSLSSAEYRAKLLTKLNCLVAVLQVAIAKISKGMELPGANEERLLKVRGNLENTLSICKRAKVTLEKGMGVSVRKRLDSPREASASGRMSYRDYVELSSIDEYQKFKSLPPIEDNELASVDLDELIEKLSDDS